MRRRVSGRGTIRRTLLAAGVLAGVVALVLVAQSNGDEAVAQGPEPAHVEHIEGSDLSEVTLEERAAERIGLRTAEVETARAGKLLSVPYSAVVYDVNGEAWVYTAPEELVFVRAPIVIESIEDDAAYLSEGPAAGTVVATVGVAELYGAEFEVDH